MSTLSANLINKKVYSIKAQTFAAFLAIVAAVAIPQLFHMMGAVSGIGTALGEIFLPMHLPIIFIGLLTGTYAGAIAGMLSPLVSFALTGMPTSAMLPFMMIELCIYGLTAGLLRNTKLPSVTKVFIVQASGRLVRAIAILIAAYAFSYSNINPSVIWLSIPKGIFGIVLQLVLVPLLLYRVENISKNER